MSAIYKNIYALQLVRFIFGLLAAGLMAACGGGGPPAASGGFGGGSGAGTTTSTTLPDNGTISIVLTDAAGTAKNTLTSGSPLTAKATVTNNAGSPLAGKIVTFSVGNAIATISPSLGTALTDSSGVAQVTIQSAGTGSGAVEITASVTVGTAEVTAKTAFSVGAAPTATPVAINFVSATPTDKSIVIKGSGGNGRTEVALLTFKLVDNSNNGIANQQVTFVAQSSQPVTLVTSSATTDSDGLVSVALNSGTAPTTVRIVATVPGTSISAISDTITVTTGQPVQAAFSLSVEKFYVEGLNHDNTPNKILVLLADSFGGAVADGTQVVFTTDSGAIVGDGGAKCLTVQGACSVGWRSQNPRVTNGLATVIATATNGSDNLASSINFYYGGSFAKVYHVTGSAGATTRLNDGGPIALNFSSSCDAQSIAIEVVDVNGNPMPEGTTISGVNGVNASAAAFPDPVGYSGLRLGLPNRGTVHSVTVTPTGCDLTGAKTVAGYIDIAVTTPLGGVTYTRISLGSFLIKT